jgi:hypothetical protein
MPARAVLLISCSKQEAQTIRQRAREQRRNISGYVLNICMRIVGIEEKLMQRTGRKSQLGFPSSRHLTLSGPRTTMLIRCSLEESRRIRAAAETEDRTISGFVLRCLRLSWRASEEISARVYGSAK